MKLFAVCRGNPAHNKTEYVVSESSREALVQKYGNNYKEIYPHARATEIKVDGYKIEVIPCM